MYFHSNLKFLRERSTDSQEQLASKLGITRSQVSAYEKGQTKNPPTDILLKISDYFKVSLDNLLKKNLSKVNDETLQELLSRSNEDISGRKLRVIVSTVNCDGSSNIEHVPLKAVAGYLQGFNEEAFIDSLPTYSLPNLSSSKKYRSFSSIGDSMYPFPENAIIVGEFLDDWLSIKDGTIAIVVTNEGIVFKQISNHITKNRVLQLHSLNRLYQPYDVNIADVIEIWKYTCFISDIVPEDNFLLNSILEKVDNIQNRVDALTESSNAPQKKIDSKL